MHSANSDMETGMPGAKQRAHRSKRLGVDLSKYPAVSQRQLFEPVVTSTNRALLWSLFRIYGDGLINRVPDPCIITQILTTRCNYGCEFCSFADSLNKKHNDLTLPEIEKLYIRRSVRA
jgi:hypothetical protein